MQRKLLPDNERSGQSLTSFAGRILLSPSLSYFIIVILYVTYITAGPALADVTRGFLRWSAAYLVCRRMTLTNHPFYCVFDFFYKKLLISIYNNLKPINIVDEVGLKWNICTARKGRKTQYEWSVAETKTKPENKSRQSRCRQPAAFLIT